MSKWEERRLGEVIQINPETLSIKKHVGEISYIDISSVHEGVLRDFKIYDIKYAPSRARRVIRPSDIIYSTVRPNLKAYYLVKGSCPKNAIASTGFAVIRTKKQANYKFIYYLTTEKSFVDYLTIVAKGSAYPALGTIDFIKAKVLLPPLPTQQKIADILSAYDDLIENNSRRIELLKKASQGIYKEWFVQKRFPGYRAVHLINGIPNGWEIVKLGELYKATSGGTPSRTIENYYLNGKYQWIKTGELKDMFIIDTDEKITDDAIKMSSAKLLPSNSLIMAMYGATIGKLGFTVEKATCNQACCVFIPKTKIYGNEFLFFNLLINRTYIIGIGVGAAQQNLSQDTIKKIKIIKPNPEIIEQFNKLVIPMLKQIRILQTQNRNLINQRDLLLPRLMSGRIEV